MPMIASTIAVRSCSIPSRLDEGAVDLQRVEREAVEVGERGVAGAEVVEDEPDAQLAAAPPASPWRLPRLLDQDALGDLELAGGPGRARCG